MKSWSATPSLIDPGDRTSALKSESVTGPRGCGNSQISRASSLGLSSVVLMWKESGDGARPCSELRDESSIAWSRGPGFTEWTMNAFETLAVEGSPTLLVAIQRRAKSLEEKLVLLPVDEQVGHIVRVL